MDGEGIRIKAKPSIKVKSKRDLGSGNRDGGTSAGGVGETRNQGGTGRSADQEIDGATRGGFPDWVKAFRPAQITACEDVMWEFRRGKRVVFLDAPTGAGKTLIAEMVRREIEREYGVKRSLYVCSGKQLQDQFARDFPYARVLKGRGNYPTERMPFPSYTAADCNAKRGKEDSCKWCSGVSRCEYQRAKKIALGGELAVLNTTYLLIEGNGPGRFATRGFVVADECDMLEKELMGYVEWRISESQMRKMEIEAPKKGAHGPTVEEWLESECLPALEDRLGVLQGDGIEVIRERKGIENKIDGLKRLLGFGLQGYVREYKDGYSDVIFKPIQVHEYGQELLWGLGERWLCMSATIISAEEMARSLGLGDDEWGLVRVGMEFPVENRPIVNWPIANVVRKEMDEAKGRLVQGIGRILEVHEGENVLVHSVSYDLGQYLYRELDRDLRVGDRKLHFYGSAKLREEVLERFKRQGGVLIAASADRGVDLPDDLCRVVIVAKIPYLSLGDKQVSERMHKDGEWYSVQTVRTLVQMTGRGVRHKEDFCVSYILDEQFQKNVLGRKKYLLPEWWLEGLREGNSRIRELSR